MWKNLEAEWWVYIILPTIVLCENSSIIKESLKQWGGDHLDLISYGTISWWWSKISNIQRLKTENLKTCIVAIII